MGNTVYKNKIITRQRWFATDLWRYSVTAWRPFLYNTQSTYIISGQHETFPNLLFSCSLLCRMREFFIVSRLSRRQTKTSLSNDTNYRHGCNDATAASVALLIYIWSSGNNLHSKRAFENTKAQRRIHARLKQHSEVSF